MKQRAHAWTSLRALKLLDDSGKAPKLVELLSYYLADAWEGSLLPDTLIIDMNYGHIYKMDSDPKMLDCEISGEDWYKVPYKNLKSLMKGSRLMLEYAKTSEELEKPYRTHKVKGGNLPDRVIAISHQISDMLKMADYPIAFYSQNKKVKTYLDNLSAQSVKDLNCSPNFSARQIALTFFILSHYICDAHMPLHCDLRDYGTEGKNATRRIPEDFHPSIEEEWENNFPAKEDLFLNAYKDKSLDQVIANLPTNSIIKIDKDPQYVLDSKIATLTNDEWKEMIYICRTSYAVSRYWIKPNGKDIKDFISGAGKAEFEKVSNYIFHDAVQSIAAIWYKIWNRFLE